MTHNRWWWIGSFAAAAIFAAATTFAQERPREGARTGPRAGERGRTQRPREGEPRSRGLGVHGQMAEFVKLTDAQKEQLTKVVEEQQKEMQALTAKHQEQVMALLTPEQREAWETEQKVGPILARFARYEGLVLTDAQKQQIKALAGQADLPADPRSREAYEAYAKLGQTIIDTVLTAEQKDKYTTARKLRVILGRLGRIELSDEQNAKVEEMVRAANLPDDPRSREAYEAYAKVGQSIIDTVLTAEQREQRTMARKMGPILYRLGRVGLTEEQRKIIEGMVKSAELPESPRSREDQDAYEKVIQTVAEVVLTPDQRAKLPPRPEPRERGERRER